MKSTSSEGKSRSADLAVEIRGLCGVQGSDCFVAYILGVPSRDSSGSPAQFERPSSTNAPKTTKRTQSRRTRMKSTSSEGKSCSADLAVEIRGLCGVQGSDSLGAHILGVPRRDSSRRPAQFERPSSTNAPKTTKRTQSRRTRMKSTSSEGKSRSADLAVEIRGLCGVQGSDSLGAHILGVPRRDSSRRPAQFERPSSTNAPKTTKRTQSRRTRMKSTSSKGKSRSKSRSADLAVEIRGLCGPAQTDNAGPLVAHDQLPDTAGLGFTRVFANRTEPHRPTSRGRRPEAQAPEMQPAGQDRYDWRTKEEKRSGTSNDPPVKEATWPIRRW